MSFEHAMKLLIKKMLEISIKNEFSKQRDILNDDEKFIFLLKKKLRIDIYNILWHDMSLY